MAKILLVEDDLVIARIYRRKLEEAGHEVATAEDGLEAMKQIPVFRPDLVVLDLMIPKLSGIDVLKYIRQHPDFNRLPVVVFTNAFLNKLWEELTALGVQEMLLKSSSTPPQLIAAIARILQQHHAREISAADSATSPAAARPSPEFPQPPPSRSSESASQFRQRIQHDFFEQIPVICGGIHLAGRDFLNAPDASSRLLRLEPLRRKIGFVTHMTSMAGCYRLAQLSSAFEALLFELQLKPSAINDSSRHTISNTISLLTSGLNLANQPDEQSLTPIQVLVLDDDPVSTRALVVTLDRVNVKATALANPFEALEKLRQNLYDAVLLDINLPEITGFAVCEQMRQMPHHAQTPVIFVTSYAEFEPRARSILSAGDDLIGKPIMPIELTVKVIAHVMKQRARLSPAVF
ncbi:MAG: response regulator [Verrucomicrobiota bacterium]